MVMEVDSQVFSELVNKGCARPYPRFSLVIKIQEIARRDWRVKFHLTFSEGNRVADWLAISALDKEFRIHLYAQPPYQCHSIFWMILLEVLSLVLWCFRPLAFLCVTKIIIIIIITKILTQKKIKKRNQKLKRALAWAWYLNVPLYVLFFSTWTDTNPKIFSWN